MNAAPTLEMIDPVTLTVGINVRKDEFLGQLYHCIQSQNLQRPGYRP